MDKPLQQKEEEKLFTAFKSQGIQKRKSFKSFQVTQQELSI